MVVVSDKRFFSLCTVMCHISLSHHHALLISPSVPSRNVFRCGSLVYSNAAHVALSKSFVISSLVWVARSSASERCVIEQGSPKQIKVHTHVKVHVRTDRIKRSSFLLF